MTEGLERAVEVMKKGAHAIVSLRADYAWGEEGINGLAVNEDVTFDVTLHDFDGVSSHHAMP
jgi:FKBP-type peptidyl-prolyl cis-trans isomerase